METLKDLVVAGRERDGTAIDVLDRTTPYSYGDFCTNAWKTGNLLGHYGTHAGSTVAVAVGPKDGDREGYVDADDPLLAVLGTTLVGATANVTPNPPVESGVLVVPAGWQDRYDPAPGCSVLAYGGPPEAADVAHFEAERWSENPVEPPERVDPDTDALQFGMETYTHGELVTATARVVDQYGLDETSTVGLAGSVIEPGGFVAGVLAGLSVGATILVADHERLQTREDVSLLVTDERLDEGKALSVSDATESIRN